MEGAMLDFGRLISRLGVGGEGIHNGGVQQPQGQSNPFADVHRNTYIFTHAGGGDIPAAPNANNGAQQQARPASSSPTRAWVNIIQHLLVTSIQGRNELHADNLFTFGANLTEFIFSKCAPIQTVPSRHIIYESFRHVNDEVLPMRIKANQR
jgi:hypothetical protein